MAVFCRLFHAYYAKLHRYAFTILKNNEAAEDIVQTVFVILWERRDKVLMADKIASYLYKTTHNLSLNYLRNNKVRKKYIKDVAGTPDTTMHNVDDEVFASELSSHIQSVIEKLPDRCRRVFLKSRTEGKKYAEIAVEMNISVKTVEAQISKALKILREESKDYL